MEWWNGFPSKSPENHAIWIDLTSIQSSNRQKTWPNISMTTLWCPAKGVKSYKIDIIQEKFLNIVIIITCLSSQTGWWFEPLWKIWVRQLGLLLFHIISNFSWKVIIHSMVPVTTNQVQYVMGMWWKCHGKKNGDIMAIHRHCFSWLSGISRVPRNRNGTEL